MRLSIIVTVYKAERFIEQCVRSLCQQDVPMADYEVIVVDNHSPDRSIDVVRELQIEFSNLNIVRLQENHCAGGGRNAGLDAAKGDYVMFVDADDYLYPDVLGGLLKEVSNDDLDFVHFDCDALVNGKIEKGNETKTTGVMTGTDLMFGCGIPWQEHVVVWRKIFTKRFLVDNHFRFVEDIVFDDDDFAFRTYVKAEKTKHINYHAYVNRYNSDSASHTNIGYPKIKCYMIQSVELLQLIKQYEKSDLNPNFVPAMRGLVRYNLSESLHHYSLMSGKEKTQTRQLIKSVFSNNMQLCNYISKRKLLKFTLGSNNKHTDINK